MKPSRWRSLLVCGFLALSALRAQAQSVEVKKALDEWLDARFDGRDVSKLLASMKAKGLGPAEVEKILRSGRSEYPEEPYPRGQLVPGVALPNDYVDHATEMMVYVPKTYDRKNAHPLLLVVHGGSATRDLMFGAAAARSGFDPFWVTEAEKRGFVMVAPLTDRGWMYIGNSILFSALAKIQRELHIDPDRIYLTGHSMGGHMSWRSAFQFPDRFAAVSPMSGGYDYVKSKDVTNLLNIPGYTTYGTTEPYQIREFNDIIATWMKEHDYPWICARREGGHEIFEDEIPKVAEFFVKNPRDLYRSRVYARMGAQPMSFEVAEKNPGWNREHTWRGGRAIPANTIHWLRCFPPLPGTPAEKSVQTVDARNLGNNRFEVTSQFARKLRIFLHPLMVDFSRPVVVTVNGKKLHDARVTPSLNTLLEHVREFDDRGRIFWAAIDLEPKTDGEPPEPKGVLK